MVRVEGEEGVMAVGEFWRGAGRRGGAIVVGEVAARVEGEGGDGSGRIVRGGVMVVG